MKDDTLQAAHMARTYLDRTIINVQLDTESAVASGSLPELVRHFDKLRQEYDDLKERLSKISDEIDNLSYTIIPTVFGNADVQSIRVDGVGNVFVSARWNASMVRKTEGMRWLKDNDAGGLIIETVNASTLASFAKEKALSGEPLPDSIFKVGTAPYTSIRRS